MKVVGLDLSLTSTGVALVTENGAVTDRITTKGARSDTLTDRHRRLRRIVMDVVNHDDRTDLVVIEGPAFSRSNPGMHDRSGLWWLVVDALERRDTTVIEVPPNLRAKYATGRGNAAKDDVLSAVIRRYPNVDVNGNDEADALILAAMGARHLGHPLEATLSPLHLEAMTKVAWPEQLGGAA